MSRAVERLCVYIRILRQVLRSHTLTLRSRRCESVATQHGKSMKIIAMSRKCFWGGGLAGIGKVYEESGKAYCQSELSTCRSSLPLSCVHVNLTTKLNVHVLVMYSRTWRFSLVPGNYRLHEFLFCTCTCRSSLPLSCVHVNLAPVVGAYTHNIMVRSVHCIIEVYVRITIQLVTLGYTLGYTLVGIRRHYWFQAL